MHDHTLSGFRASAPRWLADVMTRPVTTFDVLAAAIGASDHLAVAVAVAGVVAPLAETVQ